MIEATPRRRSQLGGLDKHDFGEAREGPEFSVDDNVRMQSMPLMLSRQTMRKTTFGRPASVKVYPRPPLCARVSLCLNLTTLVSWGRSNWRALKGSIAAVDALLPVPVGLGTEGIQ
jgi:hypothetical protein